MSYLVAFWNLENLFAPEGYPGREAWLAKALQKELAGWSEALFRRKIDQLAVIIRQMKGGAGPDILGVCEVENAFVLQTLADALNRALPRTCRSRTSASFTSRCLASVRRRRTMSSSSTVNITKAQALAFTCRKKCCY